MTSSYSSRCLRISKLRASTCFCALSIWRVMSLPARSERLPPSQRLHDSRDPVAGEDAHQIVFQREVKARRSGIALPAGAPAQLVVDAPGLMALGAEDVQAAERDHLVVLLWQTLLRCLPRCARIPVRRASGVEPFSRRLCSVRNSGLPPSRMSVPRPAMLVAMVTAFLRPA